MTIVIFLFGSYQGKSPLLGLQGSQEQGRGQEAPADRVRGGIPIMNWVPVTSEDYPNLH